CAVCSFTGGLWKDLEQARDVVLLDDEDVQPEGQLDCVVREKWNESKIYYPSRGDPEAVELSGSDIKCLDPGVYLSSLVINYYIQIILLWMSEQRLPHCPRLALLKIVAVVVTLAWSSWVAYPFMTTAVNLRKALALYPVFLMYISVGFLIIAID
ncbi:hypothetical protein ABZP36_017070, partial [Zizania latifolia]